MVLQEFSLVVLELVSFCTFARAVVDIVCFELLGRKEVGGRNIEILLEMLFFS